MCVSSLFILINCAQVESVWLKVTLFRQPGSGLLCLAGFSIYDFRNTLYIQTTVPIMNTRKIINGTMVLIVTMNKIICIFNNFATKYSRSEIMDLIYIKCNGLESN